MPLDIVLKEEVYRLNNWYAQVVENKVDIESNMLPGDLCSTYVGYITSLSNKD